MNAGVGPWGEDARARQVGAGGHGSSCYAPEDSFVLVGLLFSRSNSVMELHASARGRLVRGCVITCFIALSSQAFPSALSTPSHRVSPSASLGPAVLYPTWVPLRPGHVPVTVAQLPVTLAVSAEIPCRNQTSCSHSHPCVRELCLLDPCVPASLHPCVLELCVPVSLTFASLCPCIPVSLCACSLHPCIPASLCP